MAEDGRRYDERELALILRKAAEIQAHDPVAVPRGGLSLTEIEAIAGEVGIEASYVRRAAAVVSGERPERVLRLTGGATRVRAEEVVEGVADAEALARVAEAAREEFGRHGTVRDALGGMEWRARDELGWAWVSVRGAGGATRVVVGADRTDNAWALGLLLPIAGAIAGGIATTAIAGVPGILLGLGGAAGGLGAARLIWGRTARRWRERVDRVAAELASAVRAGTRTADDGSR